MTLNILDGKKVVGSEYYSELIESIRLIDNLLIINLEYDNVQCGWNGIYYLLYENDEYSLVLKDRSREYDLILFDKKERRESTVFVKNPLHRDEEELGLDKIRYYYILIKDLSKNEMKFINEYSMVKELRK